MEEHFYSFVGRKYAVGRLFAIVVYRVLPLKIFLSLPGITCASMMATALENIGLWNHKIPAKMAGLKEVCEVAKKISKSRNT